MEACVSGSLSLRASFWSQAVRWRAAPVVRTARAAGPVAERTAAGLRVRAGQPAAPRGAPKSLGDPGAGLVHCTNESCDVSQGEACCLWYTGDPPDPAHGCVADCASKTSSPGTTPTEISCDGPEDCGGNACCNGQCGTTSECPGGQGDWCHDASTCPADRGCCTRLANAWGGEYGLCIAPPDGGCS